MKPVRLVRHRISTFTTTGIISVNLRPAQSSSSKLLMARSAAFGLALRSAQIECRIKKRGTVPALVKVLNVAVRRKDRKLTVALTARWRCVRFMDRLNQFGPRSRASSYARFRRSSRHRYPNPCVHIGRYECPYLYPDCWSCPRRLVCPLLCRPKPLLFGRQVLLAFKKSQRHWRRSLLPTKLQRRRRRKTY